MTEKTLRLDAARLYQRTDLSEMGFETTDELPDMDGIVGQARALDAIQFGTGMKDDGFNIYALGPTGLDKQALVRVFFEARAKEAPTPSDWCYVNNFTHEHKPVAIELPAGMGQAFHDDMQQLVEELRTALSAAFESEEYQSQRQSISEEFQERQAEAFDELQSRARAEDMALIRTPGGIAVAPMRDGEVLGPEEIQELSEEEQEQIQEKTEALQDKLQGILRHVPAWQREMRERLNELNSEMADLAVGALLDELRDKYAAHESVVRHLNAVQKDVVANADQFLPQQEQDRGAQFMQTMQRQEQEQALQRYGVNVLIDHAETEGAPIIYEDNPTYQNLIGRVEHRAQMGALMTDFSLIKPGALHRANGGYLILDVRNLLLQTYAWEGLKRALKSKDLRVESLGQQFSLISTVSLEPESIPLQVKVALIGNRQLYYLLSQLDPDFDELFKVAADFDDQMDRDGETQARYARLIAETARKEKLRPLMREAVERLIEHSSRLVGDSEKLSSRMQEVTDLMREANYWAQEREHEEIAAVDVQKAIDAQIYRLDRIRENAQEAILRETLLIDTDGEAVGQINGLSVLQLSNFAFGRPTRITAQVRLGSGDVVDIEREVELGGPLHSKGVMILAGFLAGRYAQEHPLSLSASLVFEQSYGGVDGDSASSAELYALLSEISGVPIKQSFAVTGSVNQKGEVQAIGGINEKIEGFFDICQKRGLTGEQGVLIPSANVKHLMLRRDVLDAVAAGEFGIYAIDHIDQGIELLTGVSAGALDDEGAYPEGTINYRVMTRLKAMAEKRRAFARAAEEVPRE
jgi:lon-related putative ATP-dependent protease